MSEPRPTACAAAEIEAFRRAVAAALSRDRRLLSHVDSVPVVRVVVPEGMHASLWARGALVAPGRVALAWAFE